MEADHHRGIPGSGCRLAENFLPWLSSSSCLDDALCRMVLIHYLSAIHAPYKHHSSTVQPCFMPF